MIRNPVVPALLLILSSCDSVGTVFGDKPEAREHPMRQVSLPASRNVGRVPVGDRRKPLELDVGQWTRHTIRHHDGAQTEYFRQVVAEGPKGYWIEIVNGRPDAGTVTQLLVLGEPAGDGPPSLASARVRMPSGVTKVITGPAMDATRAGYQQLLSDVRLGTTWTSSPGEREVKALAGAFEGCFEAPVQARFAGIEAVEIAYYHARVPIGGLVQGLSVDGRVVVELTGFGTEGAESVLERRRRTP